MAKPRKKTSSRSSGGTKEVIALRLSREEVTLIAALMQELSMNRSEVIRLGLQSLSAPELKHGEWVRVREELEWLRGLVKKVSTDVQRIGNNLNQLTRAAHMSGVNADTLQSAFVATREQSNLFEEAVIRVTARYDGGM